MGNNNSSKKESSSNDKKEECSSNEKKETIKGSDKELGASVKKLAAYDLMDDNNKAAVDIAASEGIDAAVKHMMTDSNGKPRTYAEMRALYG